MLPKMLDIDDREDLLQLCCHLIKRPINYVVMPHPQKESSSNCHTSHQGRKSSQSWDA